MVLTKPHGTHHDINEATHTMVLHAIEHAHSHIFGQLPTDLPLNNLITIVSTPYLTHLQSPSYASVSYLMLSLFNLFFHMQYTREVVSTMHSTPTTVTVAEIDIVIAESGCVVQEVTPNSFTSVEHLEST